MRRLIIIAFILFLNDCFGQSNDPVPSVYNVIPPSPNAAALGKWGDLPVGMYTGTTSIDVPIYTVSTGDLMLPIFVNYYSGGIKVEEKASNIGLGWSLSAGGAITRTVRGIPDESGNGYLNNGIDIENVVNSDLVTMQDLFDKVNKNLTDLQPDVFTFNFFGKSGKFIVDRATRKGYLINATEKIDIDWINNGTWVITDAAGIKYHFGTYDQVLARDRTIAEQNGRIVATTVNYSSAWYLRAAVDLKGNSIFFSYIDYNTTYCQFSQETMNWMYFASPDPSAGCGNSPAVLRSWDATEILGSKISTITWSNGKIDFIYSSVLRTDLQTDDGMLQSIVVSDDATPANQIAKFIFLHSYFDIATSSVQPGCSADGTTGRLRLDKIQQESTTGGLLSPYEFYYNGSLPSYASMSQDHWGYFNGKNNSTMVPESRFQASSGEIILDGGNRNPSLASAERGAINKIVYPTGGSSEFIYELHDSYTTPFSFEIPEVPFIQYAQVKKSNMIVHPIDTDGFTVNGTTMVDGHLGSYVKVTIKIIGTCDPSVRDEGCGGELYIQPAEGTTGSAWIFANNGNVSGTIIEQVFLMNGSYDLVLEGFNSVSEIKISEGKIEGADPNFFDQGGSYNKPVGGLRISKIISKDALGNGSVINYKYHKEDDNTKSSGILVSRPVYGYTISKQKLFTTPDGQTPLLNTCFYYSRTSNSKAPLGSTQGSHICYEFVEVIKGTNTSQPAVGKSTYKYTTAANYPDNQFLGFPFPPATSFDMKRGLLLEAKEYKSQDNTMFIVKQTINNYTLPDPRYTKYLPGVVVGSQGTNYQGEPTPVIFKEFKDESLWVWLGETRERIFSSNNSCSYNEVLTKYFYDNPDHRQITRIERSTSKNEKITSYLKYPLDYTGITATDPISAGLKQLQTKSANNAMIEKTEYKSNADGSNTRLMSSIFNSYKSDLPVVDKIYLFKTSTPVNNFVPSTVAGGSVQMDNRYESKVLFHQYDIHGNILEQQKADNVKEVYLWGYNNLYPIAKIVGSDYATVSSVVSQGQIDAAVSDDPTLRTLLNNLRTNPLTKNAVIITFTYKPLVGMTSQTDPNNKTTYYEYDGFGRLILIRDQDGNIVKKLCYNYAGESEVCP